MSPGRREAHGTQQLIHLQLHSGAAWRQNCNIVRRLSACTQHTDTHLVSSYLRGNTVCLPYRALPVNAVWGNQWRLVDQIHGGANMRQWYIDMLLYI
jgi:hypothetical protein